MTTAYLYSRYSSRPQATGHSMTRQLEAAQAYAEAHKLTLDTTLRDPALSGYTGENRVKGALASFLNRIEAREIEPGSYLLVDSMDRLSRESVMRVMNIITSIVLAGVRVVTLQDERVLDAKSEMADVMMAILEVSRSNRESVEKGRKVAKAHKASKERARTEGRVWHTGGPSWLRWETDHWEEVEPLVGIVRRLFDELEAGSGTTAIARQLNLEGVATPKHGKGWHHSTVLEIVKSRTVIGEYQPKLFEGKNKPRVNDGEAIPGYYKAIISPEQFARVQVILAARNVKGGIRGRTGPEFTNVFKGVAKCGKCGGTVGIHVANSNNKYSKSALVCRDGARSHGCDQKTRYPYDALEASVLTHVRTLTIATDLTKTSLEERREEKIAQRDKIKASIARLIDQLEDDDLADLVKPRIKERKAELTSVENEILAFTREIGLGSSVTSLFDRQDELRELIARVNDLSGEQRLVVRQRMNEIIRAIVDRIEFGSTTGKLAGNPVFHPEVVTVSSMNGASLQRFARDGTLLDTYDLVHPTRPVSEQYSQGDPGRVRVLEALRGGSDQKS